MSSSKSVYNSPSLFDSDGNEINVESDTEVIDNENKDQTPIVIS